MVPRWRFFASRIFSEPRAAYATDLHPKFALRPDIQSATADIRPGKKKKKKEEEDTTGQKIMASLFHRAAIKSYTYTMSHKKEPTYFCQ